MNQVENSKRFLVGEIRGLQADVELQVHVCFYDCSVPQAFVHREASILSQGCFDSEGKVNVTTVFPSFFLLKLAINHSL